MTEGSNAHNLATRLRALARTRGAQIALRFPNQGGWAETTFAELDTRTDAHARGFLAAGVRPGDRVLLAVRPDSSFYPVSFGLLRIGAVPVFIDPGMGRAATLRCIGQIRPRVLLAASPVHAVSCVARAPFATAVPADAAHGGAYGVVWAEAGGGGTAAGVSVVNRVGIRVYLSVGPGGSPEAAFSIDSMTAERDADGLPVVAARVHNTGGRALDLSGTLELSNGPASLSAGPFPAALGTTLAPGDTETVRFALDARLPSGPWDAVITLHSGEVEEIASATISFPVAGTSPAVSTTGPAGPARWPWLVLAVLVLIVVIVARRRGRPTDPRMTGRTPHSGRSTGADELRTR